MADNVNLTAGDGTIIAGADVIGGVSYPRAKVVWGPDNTVNDTDVATGKPLPVQLRSDVGTAVVVVEDAAAASDPVGPALMAVRRDTLVTNEVSADGDNIALKATNKGQLHVLAAIDSTQLGSLGQTTMSASAPVVIASNQSNLPIKNGASQYETVAASATNQVMGATGAAGDYLSHVIVSPGTAGCGVVTVLDNATAVASFPGGGTTALTSLIPFIIPIGIVSTSGAWKITTGSNVTAVGVGTFT